MKPVSLERFVEDFGEQLRQGSAAIFAGAGLSVGAGFVDWKSLLKPLADDLDLNLDLETDLVRVAQYHVNHHGDNRADLNEAILNGFARKTAKITPSHQILARLPISTYWTTNYDSCIEDALEANYKKVDLKHSTNSLTTNLRGRDATVYKMHGHHGEPGEAVLCKADYESYHIKRGDFLTALAGDLLSKCFLFIGFSFTDPNLDYVLSRLHTRFGGQINKHYCFVREEKRRADDAPGAYEYRHAKQQYFIRDLQRYGIRAVLVKEYDDVPKVLALIEQRYKSKTVFISGAAVEYGERWTSDEALQFVHGLAGRLAADDYRVVTGLGLGIGSAVVDGVLQQIYHEQRGRLTDQLVIRPFPQSEAGKKDWEAYREDMLAYAGLAVFMFGNRLKQATSEVELSDGVEQEFAIALKKGTKVLPLGFTGYVARELYDRVAADFDAFYPRATQRFRTLFGLLGDDNRTLSDQLETTVESLKELQRM